MLLKNYFSIYVGNKNSNHENKKGKYIFWTCNPIATKCNTWNFDGEYIILAGNNAIGNFHVNFSSGKIDAYQRTYLIQSKSSSYLNKYLYYQFYKNKQYFTKNSKGTSTKYLTVNIIENFKLISKNVIDQQHIIDIIEPFEKLKSNLEEQKEKITNLLKCIYKIFSSKEEVFLSELVKISSTKYDNQKYYVDTSNIGILNFKGKEIITKLKSRANLTPSLDSFIISKMIGENKVFPIYDLYFKNFVYSTGFLNLIPLKFEAYILGYLLSDDFIKNKGNLATGTLMASLTKSSFNNLKIKRPIVENISKTTQLITLLNKIEITIMQTNTLITNLINKLIN